MQSHLIYGKTLTFFCTCVFLVVGEKFHVPCDTGWSLSKYSGTCLKVSDDRKTWAQARQACQKQGGDLVKILDSNMNSFTIGLFNESRSSVHIGLKRTKGKDHWRNESSYAHFSLITTRSSSSRKGCGKIDNIGVWTLDRDCVFETYYICEKGPELCPSEWLPSAASGTCIKVFDEEGSKMTWEKARQQCMNLSGDLIVTLDDSMNNFLYDQVINERNVSLWIGLNNIEERDNFKWLDYAEQVTYERWDNGRPRSFSFRPQVCTVINSKLANRSKSWFDVPCREKHSFVCEMFSSCENRKYGMLCPYKCSVNCMKAACNRRTGSCADGCISGYVGPKCAVGVKPIHDLNVAIAVALVSTLVLGCILVLLQIFQSKSPSRRKKKRRKTQIDYRVVRTRWDGSTAGGHQHIIGFIKKSSDMGSYNKKFKGMCDLPGVSYI